MHEHSIKILEFDKIRNELAEYCVGSEGRDMVFSQGFIFDRGELNHIHDHVDEVRSYLDRENLPSFDFPRLNELNRHLKTEGVVFEGEEIYGYARFFLSARRLREYLVKSEDYGYKLLPTMGRGIGDFSGVAKEITRVLNPDGTVREDHPELRRFRHRLAGLRSEMNRLARDYLQGNRDRWQSDVPTQRDGRTVLPMKSNYRSMVDGVIHYSSARGSTVYIEPPDIMTKNNDIALVEEEIRELIHAILRDLTGKLAEYRDEVEQLFGTVARIDTFLCRGRYAASHKGVRALPREHGFLLKRARHPLLRGNAVPIDIGTEEDIRALIISGPNAGGKTVTLKTVGLLAMMNQFGMQIPADEGSELAVFNGIFGDVGDEQSIEGSLSTFSGHMQVISEMLRHADRRSLMLLDELGSGTDPGEGATLAMAILDECINRGATVLATSHHGLMKNYGYTTAHVQNASMDFDDSTLAPNYRVIVGMPGESHALDIAARSGLPTGVVEKARDYFTRDSGEVGKMIRELEKKQSELKSAEEELKERDLKMREKIRENDLVTLKLRQKEHQLKQNGYGELNKFLHEARRELENLVSDLKKDAAPGKDLSKKDTMKVKHFIEDLEGRTEAEQKELEEEEESRTDGEKYEFHPGMEVVAGQGKQRGILLRPAKKNHWIVEVGAMKITLPERELVPKVRDKGRQQTGGGVSYAYSEGTDAPRASFVLDLRGKRLDEALDLMNRQIDNALLSGMREFEVIHGKGEGVLQTGVRKLLAESPNVEDFTFSRPEMGGTGKTIVKLK